MAAAVAAFHPNLAVAVVVGVVVYGAALVLLRVHDQPSCRSSSPAAPREPSMREVVIVSLEVVGKAMAGPGIRAYNFAKELAESHAVTLVVPNQDADVGGDFELIRRRTLSLRDYRRLLVGADAIVAQHLPVELMHYLARRDVRTVYDLYVPFATENLGHHATQGSRPAYRRLAYRSGNLLQQAALATGNARLRERAPAGFLAGGSLPG
jgi:hypothetical protein